MNSNKTTMSPARSPAAPMKSTWLVKLLLTLLAVLVVGGVAAWYYLGKTAQAKAVVSGATTSTTTVQRGDIRLTASGSGTLLSNQVINMSFSTSGRVAELNVKLGDVVKTGDVLARLENASDLEANLVSAQANLLEAKQTLAALQKKGGSTLAKAYQDLLTAQTTYNDALKASQRMESARCSAEVLNKYKTALEDATGKWNFLIQQEASQDDITVASYDYDTALANYTYCSAYTATEKTSAQSSLEVAKAALEEAQNTYDTLKAAAGVDPDTLKMNETKVETAQTAVDTAQEALDGITLVAPISGKITALTASVGAIVDTATFLTISDISQPTVTISLDETDMDKLVVGNTATVTFSALPGKTFSGKVSVANPTMNSFGPFRAASGQIALDSEAAKALENLPLGLSATIKIEGKSATNVLVVPVTALKTLKSGGYAVMRVGSDGKQTEQAVSVGIQDTTSAEITAGLKEGDLVNVTTSSSRSNSNSNQGGDFFFGGGPQP